MHCDGQVGLAPGDLRHRLYQSCFLYSPVFWSGYVSESFFFKVELKGTFRHVCPLPCPCSTRDETVTRTWIWTSSRQPRVHTGGKSIGAAPDAGVGSSAAGTCCSQNWWTAFLTPYLPLAASTRSNLNWRHLPGVIGTTFPRHANPRGTSRDSALANMTPYLVPALPRALLLALSFFSVLFFLFDQEEISNPKKNHWLAIKGSKRIEVRLIGHILVFDWSVVGCVASHLSWCSTTKWNHLIKFNNWQVRIDPLVRTLMSLHISTTSLNVIALLIANASLVKMTTLIPFAGELAQITVRLSDAWSLNCENSFFSGYSRVGGRKCRGTLATWNWLVLK